ncbi:protein FAM133-like isoform X2 [Centruroides vittatus]|uniref:protein FAM133-like isoform X2 n=1 Tax=Centruroides vittatus TaxID=120091 RepID=UPI00350FAAA1
MSVALTRHVHTNHMCLMDISSLENKSISLNKRTVFKGENSLQDGRNHEISATEIIPENLLNYQLILPSKEHNKLKPVPVSFRGYLEVVETLDLPDELNIKNVNKDIAKFDNLRQRFLPFGSNDPLPSFIKNENVKKKKKKKKEHACKDTKDFSTNKQNSNDSLLEERDINFSLYNQDLKSSVTENKNSLEQCTKNSPKKKSKNEEFNKCTQNLTVLPNQNVFSSDSDEICWHPEDREEKRKSKERRKRKHDTDLTELHNHEKHKKRSRHLDDLSSNQNNSVNELNLSEPSSLFINELNQHPSKRPKKEVDSEEIMSDSVTNTKKTKKKKHKKDKV